MDVPTLQFLMADGHGDPNTSTDYREVVGALYAVSYAVRAVAKEELGQVHTVGPLEGLWSADNLDAFRTRNKDAWDWTLMIVQPEGITLAIVEEALRRLGRRQVANKQLGNSLVAAQHRVRLDSHTDGLSVQILHLGPYDDEGPTLKRMHEDYLPDHGLVARGRHHEIYLSDARKTDPARLKTVLRQPVAPVTERGVT